jgi:hypothetical protein
MKINKIWLVLSVICFGISVAFAGDQMEEEYLVKINGMELQRSSAENLLRYVGERGGKFTDVDGNEVTKIQRNLELSSKDPLVIEVAKVYRHCRSNREMLGLDRRDDTDNSNCYIYSFKLEDQERSKKISICFDKNTKMINTLVVLY